MVVHPSTIAIGDYTYDLPDERVPKFPLQQRDQSRLLTFKNKVITEDRFQNLAQYLPKDSLLVFNETRVIPARLFFQNRNHKQIEVFCLEPEASYHSLNEALSSKGKVLWNCLVGGLRSWKEEVLVQTKEGLDLQARIQQKHEGFVTIQFNWNDSSLSFSEVLQYFGNLPIPPYLNRATEASDLQQYQTVYSRAEGSVAAPTAGLHFTPEVFVSLDQAGIKKANIVLHVGAGTFQPVRSERLEGHSMHAEYIEFSRSFLGRLIAHNPRPVIAVGTTSLRSIESLYWMGVKAGQKPDSTLEQLEVQQWDPYESFEQLPDMASALDNLLVWMEKNNCEQVVCKTRILIAPPYELKIAQGIITNFHQPQSTLLLLISAIVGNAWKSIYEYALANKFRFLSYGDSSLLLK